MKLGSRQLNILEALDRHGSWRNKFGGWVWDTALATERTLDQLVDKGLVNRTSMNIPGNPPFYVINNKGIKHLQEVT